MRTNNGGEYASKAFAEFCDSKCIKREIIAPYNPSQNGVAERMNRTIQGFWAEVVAIAVHLINRSPSKVGDKEAVAEMV